MPSKRGRPRKSAAPDERAQASTSRNTRNKEKGRATTSEYFDKSVGSFPSKSTGKSRHRTNNDSEIRDAFRLFAVPYTGLDDEEQEEVDEGEDEGEGWVRILDVRRCLRALGLPKQPPDFFDPDQTLVPWPHFLALAQTLRDTNPAATGHSDARSPSPAANPYRADIDHAFALFTTPIPAAGFAKEERVSAPEGRRITVADLKRVAREIREEVDEGTLRMMIEEALGETGDEAVRRGVGVEEFEGIMKRAGVFG